MPKLPPNANDSIDLGTLVRAVSDDAIVGQRSEYAPSKGRVLEDSETGTVYVGNGSAWVDVDAGSGVTSPAVNADSIVDNDDGQAWETLRELGYESGDVIPLLFTSEGRANSGSTSSSSFQGMNSTFSIRIRWDRIVPAGVTAVVSLGGFLNANGDEVFFKMRNVSDGEDVTQTISSTGSEGVTSTYSTYTPTTTDGLLLINGFLRNSDGATSVTVREPSLVIGAQL